MNHRLHHCFTLIILMTVALCVASLPIVYTDPFPAGWVAHVFFSLLYVAQYFLAACIFGLLTYPIIYFVRRAWLKISILSLLCALFIIPVFFNAVVYGFWRIHITNELIHMFFVSGVGGQIFEMSDQTFYWLMRAIFYSVVAAVGMVFISLLHDQRFPTKTLLGVLGGVYLFSQGLFIYCATQNNMTLLQYAVKLPLFYETSWANGLRLLGLSVFPKDSFSVKIQRILNEKKPLKYPLHPLQYQTPAKKLNVLLIAIDTLRYDMMNPKNMPQVYQFSKSTQQFLENISGGDCTKAGIFSIFYSIPSTYWAAARAQQQPAVITQAFQDQHYALALLGSAAFSSPAFDQTVFAQVPNLQIVTAGETPMARDITITRQMQDFLKKSAKTHHPFFGFVFYDAPHAYNAIGLKKPFSPAKPLRYFTITRDANPKPFFRMYQNAVFADDALIGALLQTVKENGLLKNTVVIITSDHGQEYNEYHNNYWEHANGFSRYQIHTPLLIYWPGKKPAIYYHRTTHFDFAPTLLKRVLGVQNDAHDYSVGQDFFKTQRQPTAFVIANYAYPAIVWSDHALLLQDSGLYRQVDHKMSPLSPQISRVGRAASVWKTMEAWY